MTTATQIRERPILFSSAMVRAILDGRKSMTRRVIKPQPPEGRSVNICHYSPTGWAQCDSPELNGPHGCYCSAHVRGWWPGEQLWVRESFYDRADYATIGKCHKERFVYVADGVKSGWRAHPSIHMPRIASRITLEITDVRVERLQAITEDDAKAEGVQLMVSHDGKPLVRISGKHPPCDYIPSGLDTDEAMRQSWTFRTHFAGLWDGINGKKHPWSSNPWVWVIEFKRI